MSVMSQEFHRGMEKAVYHEALSLRDANFLLKYFENPEKLKIRRSKIKLVHLLNNLVPYYVTDEQAHRALDYIPDWKKLLDEDY
jgi:hypothetical protein